MTAAASAHAAPTVPAAVRSIRDPERAQGALEAWQRVDPERHAALVGALKEDVYSGVYVIEAGRELVAAKQSARVSEERQIYERVLPQLGLGSVPFKGGATDASGRPWLFLGYVDGDAYDERNARHRRAASAWLGQLHRRSAVAPPQLRSVDAATYAEQAQIAIGRLQGETGVTRHPQLAQLAATLDSVLGRWDRFQSTLARSPRCLVHGDFIRKNVRVTTSAVPVVHVFDWGAAAVGTPCEDLAGLDRDAYFEGADDNRWAEAVAPLFPYADLCRLLFWIQASTAHLGGEWRTEAAAQLVDYGLRLDDLVAGLR